MGWVRYSSRRADSTLRFAHVLVVAMTVAVAVSAASSLSGCIRVSPHFEIVDCVDRFLDAASAGDLSAVKALTLGRPDGWERALGAVAPAWCYSEIAGVERSDDGARVSVRPEPALSRTSDLPDPAESEERECIEWVIVLVRVDGVWFVDLNKTLTSE